MKLVLINLYKIRVIIKILKQVLINNNRNYISFYLTLINKARRDNYNKST